MSTCAPGLNKNNFCNTLYVRTINNRIILYLAGDNFFNFEGSTKSQNVKIQAFWEIIRVQNWNSKVRTCKNKHCKKNSYKGIYVHPFFCDIEAMANKKRRTAMVLYKITNKAPLTSMFWDPLIINDDQWLLKYGGQRRFIGEAVPSGICLYRKRDVFDISRLRKAQLIK